jgi:hypothetical protein
MIDTGWAGAVLPGPAEVSPPFEQKSPTIWQKPTAISIFFFKFRYFSASFGLYYVNFYLKDTNRYLLSLILLFFRYFWLNQYVAVPLSRLSRFDRKFPL